MEYGDGDLDHQNSIRSQASLTGSSVSVKTKTARCSLAGTAEFIVSSTAKRKRIQYPEEWARSGREGCFMIVMVVCGSEPSTRELYTYMKEGQMYLDSHRASQAIPVTYFLKIAKEISG